MATATKKEKKKKKLTLGRPVLVAGTSSGHTTNLKQSILGLSMSMELTQSEHISFVTITKNLVS
jgi:hypothetical protein